MYSKTSEWCLYKKKRGHTKTQRRHKWPCDKVSRGWSDRPRNWRTRRMAGKCQNLGTSKDTSSPEPWRGHGPAHDLIPNSQPLNLWEKMPYYCAKPLRWYVMIAQRDEGTRLAKCVHIGMFTHCVHTGRAGFHSYPLVHRGRNTEGRPPKLPSTYCVPCHNKRQLMECPQWSAPINRRGSSSAEAKLGLITDPMNLRGNILV